MDVAWLDYQSVAFSEFQGLAVERALVEPPRDKDHLEGVVLVLRVAARLEDFDVVHRVDDRLQPWLPSRLPRPDKARDGEEGFLYKAFV